MFKSLPIKRGIACVFFLLPLFSYSSDINVCLWKGKNPKTVMSEFQNKHRGDLKAVKQNGQYFIINKIDMEEYLVGVLAKEMDSLWPMEALKAQAVLSRTFALNKIAENKNRKQPYDIENSIYHQVYGSTDCVKIEEAVYSTKGEVLSHNKKLAQVFFHANCGGRTAAPHEVWGGSYPLLTSTEDPYCENTPYYSWEKTFTKSMLSKLLNLPPVEKLTVADRHMSGRVKNLKFLFKDGNIRLLPAHKFRMEINSKASKVFFSKPHIIPSTNFAIIQKRDSIIFKGTGYGHGVGMCQWGARQMAEKGGKSYREIFHFYFANLVLENIDSLDE